MYVVLKGSSPATLAAGILLLSRARRLGQRLQVEILGEPSDIGVMQGPALLYSTPLASCGVGRELGSGATVIVPGPATEPLAVSLASDGRADWCLVDRSGGGLHPATRAFLALRKDTRVRARWLAQQLSRGLETLGCVPEPAVLDLLFGAPVPPLSRLAVALRAGRAISGERGEPVTRFLVGDLDESMEAMSLDGALSRLRAPLPDAVRAIQRTFEALSQEPTDKLPSLAPLADALSELLCHLAMIPEHGMLPPLDPTMDAVAVHLRAGLGATQGNDQAQIKLVETYRFLGGRFTDRCDHPVLLPCEAPPQERLARWVWFCTQVNEAERRVERIWRDLMDPPQ